VCTFRIYENVNVFQGYIYEDEMLSMVDKFSIQYLFHSQHFFDCIPNLYIDNTIDNRICGVTKEKEVSQNQNTGQIENFEEERNPTYDINECADKQHRPGFCADSVSMFGEPNLSFHLFSLCLSFTSPGVGALLVGIHKGCVSV
jgi:hypothetical protein